MISRALNTDVNILGAYGRFWAEHSTIYPLLSAFSIILFYFACAFSYNTNGIASHESSVRFPNAQGYTGVRACGRGQKAVVQRPNGLVELAEIPGAEARIVTEVRVLAEDTPGRRGQKRACYS